MANLILKDGIGKIEIVFIGTGGGGSNLNGDNNMIIEKGGEKILVDYGTTVTNKFPLQNLNNHNDIYAQEITAILPTNLDSDHIGGLYSLLVPSPTNPNPPTIPINLLVPNNVFAGAFWDIFKLNLTPGSDFKNYFILQKADEYNFLSYNGLSIEYFGVNNNYGIYIDNRIYYSGDTEHIPTINYFEHNRAPKAYFQKCQYYHNQNPQPYNNLISSLDQNLRDKMNLMHYLDGAQIYNSDFKGIASPLEIFTYP